MASKIPLECFTEHFRKVGLSQDQNDDEKMFDPCAINHSINEDLNNDFTEAEIKLLISKLKSSKACGIDNIRNGFLKKCLK